jgi:hypothetical protein
VDLDHVLRTGGPVQAVYVLRDHALDQPPPLQLRQRSVGGVRLFVAERLEARPVVGPEALGIALEDVDMGDLHRVDVRPETRLRRTEIRDPRRDRDAGAGEGDRG